MRLNLSIPQKLVLGCGVSFILIIILNVLFSVTFRNYTQSFSRLEENEKLIVRLGEVLSLIKDAETGQRGYIITENSSYLEPFNASVDKIDKSILLLKRLIPADHKDEFLKISQSADEKVEEMRLTVTLVNSGKTDKAISIVKQNYGKTRMVELRQLIGKLRTEQREKREKILTSLKGGLGKTVWLLLAGTIISISILSLGAVQTISEFRKRKAAEIELLEKNKEIESYNEELLTANEELNASTEEVVCINEELEKTNKQLAVNNDKLQNLSDESHSKNEQLRKLNKDLVTYSIELNDIYNNSPCAYHSLDREGIYIKINDTELSWLGYSREEIIGKKSFSDFLTEEHKEIFNVKFPEFKRTGLVKNLEFDIIKKDGTVMAILLNSSAVYDEKNNFQMSRTTFIDHTALKKTSELLAQQTREMESFSYSISHDLRAPLRAIAGFTRILQNEYQATLDEEGGRLLRVIADNAKRMGQLIDSLLEFSRLGKKSLSKVKLSMEEIIFPIIEDQKKIYCDKRYKVEVAEMPTVFIDKQLFNQVWQNLISNAFKYSTKVESPKIVIGCEENDKDYSFFIKDNGAGFDMKYAHNLFGVFQRLHGENEFEGTGVGLAIVDKIVKSHGGIIKAESEVNKGATFYFTLPKELELKEKALL